MENIERSYGKTRIVNGRELAGEFQTHLPERFGNIDEKSGRTTRRHCTLLFALIQ